MADTKTTRTVWELARLADVQSPDSDSSPGAEWLKLVESCAADLEPGSDRDRITEEADSVVPVYTHNRWQVFVDLCAYTEDVSEFGEPEDLTQAAGIALYMIAERLLTALADDPVEDDDDDEDDRDVIK